MSGASPSPAKLREAIAEAVWSHISADDVPLFCHAVGMPPGAADLNPWSSKRRYVRTRLIGVSGTELQRVAAAVAEQYDDRELALLLAPAGVRGVDGELKNVIFATIGPKPRIVLRDAINNIIEIVEHADTCLIFDRALNRPGLTWDELVDWWAETSPTAGPDPARSLFRRLRDSLSSPPERLLFNTYGERYRGATGGPAPAVIPQVYLHYDPYTMRELASRSGEVLKRQRMDFLLLFGDGSRVVIEVDGKQHYAVGDTASPRLYGEMVAEDRRLRLAGYEIYRFGGYELRHGPAAEQLVRDFFDALLTRHESGPAPTRSDAA
jgi:very-short-patch-repair endonuclease